MRRTSFFLAGLGLSAAVLVLAGASCQPAQVVDKTAGDVINGAVVVPLKALDKAKQLSSDEKARVNLENESLANEMTVAMVLTDGAAPPAGADIVSGTFGCNDRIAFVKAPRESDSGDTLKDVLASLFAVHDATYKTYYNGLADSRLEVDKIQSLDGVTTDVWLKGKISSPGECADPRIKEQIEATVRRLRPKYRIFLNGSETNFKCIGDLSGRCGQDEKK